MPIPKRRRLLVKRAFQLKYTGIILLFIFLTVAISSVVVYLAIFPLLSEKLANLYPQGRLVAVLKDVNAKLFLSTALLLPIAAWLGIILSHRIAGPWFRIERILRDIARGNLSEVKLRRADELHSIADAINELTESISSMSEEIHQHLQSLEETLRDFERGLNQEPIDLIKAKLLISKIQDISAEIDGLAKKYRRIRREATETVEIYSLH